MPANFAHYEELEQLEVIGYYGPHSGNWDVTRKHLKYNSNKTQLNILNHSLFLADGLCG